MLPQGVARQRPARERFDNYIREISLPRGRERPARTLIPEARRAPFVAAEAVSRRQTEIDRQIVFRKEMDRPAQRPALDKPRLRGAFSVRSEGQRMERILRILRLKAAERPRDSARGRGCGKILSSETPEADILFRHDGCSEAQSVSSSCCQTAAQASLGIRQSPLGESVTEPTFGPSGRQLRLNCCWKKRR